MTALIIIAVIAAIICIILFSRIRVMLELNDELTVSVAYLFLKIRLVPSSKKKIKLSKYSYKKTHKEKKKKPKKKKKHKQSQEQKSESDKKSAPSSSKNDPTAENTGGQTEEQPKKSSVVKLLYDLRNVILSTVKRVPGKLRLNIYRLYLSVGASDAAATAIMYGTVVQSVGSALTIAESYADVRIAKKAIMILPDYLSGKIMASVKIKLSVRVGSVLGLALRFIFGVIKVKLSPSDT